MAHILANGLRQHYRLEGPAVAPVLVLAHPVGFGLELWDDVVPLLAPHWRVLRYDLRGHGATEVTHGEYSVEQLAADALLLTYELGIERFMFCGVSLGALVGLWLGARHPRALTHLVVSNVSPCLPLARDEWDTRIALARTQGMGSFADGVRARMFSQAYRESGAPLCTRLMDRFRSTDSQGYAASLAALRDTDMRPMLPGIRVPLLAIGGNDDLAVPRDHVEAIAQAVPGARLLMLPGGHLSAAEQPLAFGAALTQFLGTS